MVYKTILYLIGEPIFIKVLKIYFWNIEGGYKTFFSFSSSNWWSNKTSQSNSSSVFMIQHKLLATQLDNISNASGVCIL